MNFRRAALLLLAPLKYLWITLCRSLLSRKQFERLTAWEKRRLQSAAPPVKRPLAQNYAAWRKSLLTVATVCLAVHLAVEIRNHQDLFKVVWQFGEETGAAEFQGILDRQSQLYALGLASDVNTPLLYLGREELDAERKRYAEEYARLFTDAFGDWNFEVVKALAILQWIGLGLGILLIAAARLLWRNLRWSKRLALWGWTVMIVFPLLMAMTPVRYLLHFEDRDNPALAEMANGFAAGFYAMVYLQVLGPKIISLFPAVLRSGATVRALLPESTTPGWVLVVVAPIYAFALLVTGAILNQFNLPWGLTAGVYVLAITPIAFVIGGKIIVRPLGRPKRGMIGRVRLVASLGQLAGAGLIAGFLWQHELMTLEALGLFAVGYMGNLLLLTVVGTDVVLRLVHAIYVQNRSLQASDLHASLERELPELMTTERMLPVALPVRPLTGDTIDLPAEAVLPHVQAEPAIIEPRRG